MLERYPLGDTMKPAAVDIPVKSRVAMMRAKLFETSSDVSPVEKCAEDG